MTVTRNIRKVKGHRTVKLIPYGRVPIKDARESVTLTVDAEHVRKGKKNSPPACAIALATRDNPEKFPGTLLGSWIYKTHSIIATMINERIQARRYVHTEPCRLAINGFDASDADHALGVGDEVVLLAPKGYKKLGAANGTSRSGSGYPAKRKGTPFCRKRGVFVDPLHAKQAEQEMRGTKDQVLV